MQYRKDSYRFSCSACQCTGVDRSHRQLQVCEYNERLQQSEVLKYLTQEEVENKTASGKVGFAVNYNGKPAAEVEAITNALQSYEDGIFRIFMDDTETGDLSSPIQQCHCLFV